MSFTNRNIEIEHGNDFTESWKVNTGHLDSRRMRDFWFEFFRSTNRYVQTPDGLRRIVVGKLDAEHQEFRLNDYSFEYRLSEPNNGAYFARKKLPEFENLSKL